MTRNRQTTVGLVVNPAAGRDIRRLTGGASVSDNYAKRRTAECVLEGLTVVDDVHVSVMPDTTGLASALVDDAPADLDVELLDMTVTASGRDTQQAAERFADEADVAVVLGGDGTNRDIAHGIGDVPVVSVSTGTNNVVPTPVDGTVAGAAAALVGSGMVPADEATYRHGMVEAQIDRDGADDGVESIRGLATLGVLDRPFVGTRAILDPDDVIGGVVSRASSTEIGLSGIPGGFLTHRPDDPGGVGFRLAPPREATRCVRSITVPGVLSTVGVDDYRVLDDEEAYVFEVDRGVVSVDGERELAVRDATVRARPVADGPRFVRIEEVVERGAETGLFRVERPTPE
ncbi:ATP-NAD kinase [Halogranum amylolyticum]|uniref:ATP-NAD kinase n=1 Tax=Halogranum amylolyticum TaxID=660520 RepID=A0A1H8PR54_9EURY|nr:NAD(+)/NADH kinase [Halogranum amylolyticum]SEO44231.1 ATP-NAD kinase [Halogranum amylolyticum]